MNWRRRIQLGALAWLLALASAACTTPKPIAYTPEALRAELARRHFSVEERVVPFEVEPELIERARALAPPTLGAHDRILALLDALGDPGGFGLRHAWAVGNTAERTLDAGRGTCLGLSSVLVGLARGLGLEAYYLDASSAALERREEEEVRVSAGHIGVVARTERGALYVDFSGSMTERHSFRRIDDLEAVAHYHINRGYELIHGAQSEGRSVPWEEVRRQFELATVAAPRLASGWNNLGVALARLGDFDRAERTYRTAIALDPGMSSAELNLTQLEDRRDAASP